MVNLAWLAPIEFLIDGFQTSLRKEDALILIGKLPIEPMLTAPLLGLKICQK